MKAINITGTPPGGVRTPIAQLVPLYTPLLLQIFPIYACNFICKYCTFSIPKNQRSFISNVKEMPLDLFCKCVDDCKNFNNKIKVLRFVGMGEPLLHPYISSMVYYAKKSKCFERIEILTNGSLLTPLLSKNLIDSGLTKLLISIQGTSAKKYKEISGITIDFDKFINNITYFYNNRNNTKVHIKIIDCALDDEKDKQKFFELFGDICDSIGIEHVGPIYPGVNYNVLLSEKQQENQYGTLTANIPICTQAFFAMQINPDGKIAPCHSIPYPESMGNCNEESLVDIWNGEKYNNFRYRMLDGIRQMNNLCVDCKIFTHRAYEDDDLSTKIDKLKLIYKPNKQHVSNANRCM